MLKNVLKTLAGYLMLVLGAIGFVFSLWVFLDPQILQLSSDSDTLGMIVSGYVAIQYAIIYLIIAVLGWLILRASNAR